MNIQIKIAPNGRVCIPADVRERLGVNGGDTLILEETDGGIVLRTRAQAIREVQAITRRLLRGKPNSTVDDFIAERRLEAAREAEEF